ncbi:hypothetical protein ABRS97_27950, partial [Paenibacillus sp. SI92]
SIKFDVTTTLIDEKLMKGYALDDVEQALIFWQQSKGDLNQILEIIRPKNINVLTSKNKVTAASENYMSSYDSNAINSVNLRADQAPFSISSGNDQMSTLSGNLSVRESDLTLPGRNGLSFTLSRIYNSQSSNYFKEDVEIINIGGFQFQYNAYQYTQTRYKDVIVSNSTPAYYVGYETRSTAQDDDQAKKWVTANAGKDVSYSNWSVPDSNGYSTRTVTGISSNAGLRVLFYNINSSAPPAYRNIARNKTKEAEKFPIGIGWTWNIPYVSLDSSTEYLRLPDGGTAELTRINDWYYLKNYHLDDISFNSNSTIRVNNVPSSYELHYKATGVSYYFDGRGNLIEIKDNNDNTIQFFYSHFEGYDYFPTQIQDAIGNTINIDYQPSQVTLTSGRKTVIYNKVPKDVAIPDQPWFNTKIDFLASVQNAQGTTQYSYLPGDNVTSFNFTSKDYGDAKTVNHALLSAVQYPTGAKSIFSYENSPVSRYGAVYAYSQEYRAISRQDQIGDGIAYNLMNYKYTGDMGGHYTNEGIRNDSITSTDVTEGTKTTTYTYKKHFINYQKLGGTPDCE